MTTEEVDRSVERVRLELSTRKFMVTLLALTGVWVGIAIVLTGAPGFIETWFSPWSRYAVGGFAFAAGVTTSIGGLMNDHRTPGWWTQVVGLSALAAWYAIMGLAYAGLLISEGIRLAAPGEPLNVLSTGRGYIPLVYLGLMLLTLVPLWTMIALRPNGPWGVK